MSKEGLKKLVSDIQEISKHYRVKAAAQLNFLIIDERWEKGKRIIEEEQKGRYGQCMAQISSKNYLLNSPSNSVKDIALMHWLLSPALYLFPRQKDFADASAKSHMVTYSGHSRRKE